jgi:hypothetical protein
MEKGYKIIRNAIDKFYLGGISRDLEAVALTCNPEDVLELKMVI